MKTRSQTKQEIVSMMPLPEDVATREILKKDPSSDIYEVKFVELEVNINFDEASAAWKSNKRSTGNGTYKYVCQGVSKTGVKCSREPVLFCDYCKRHQIKNNI